MMIIASGAESSTLRTSSEDSMAQGLHPGPARASAGSLRVTLLASLPTLGAALGASLDETRAFGLSTWRSACRAEGLSLQSLTQFTWQLLPNMIAGALLGAFGLLAVAFFARERQRLVQECTAAHLGCFIAMPVALVTCSLALPAFAMPLVDLGLATLAALGALLLIRRQSAATAHP
jgi:hypothetical protein